MVVLCLYAPYRSQCSKHARCRKISSNVTAAHDIEQSVRAVKGRIHRCAPSAARSPSHFCHCGTTHMVVAKWPVLPLLCMPDETHSTRLPMSAPSWMARDSPHSFTSLPTVPQAHSAGGSSRMQSARACWQALRRPLGAAATSAMQRCSAGCGRVGEGWRR